MKGWYSEGAQAEKEWLCVRTGLRLEGQHPAPHTSLLLLFRLDHTRTPRPALVRYWSLAGSALGAAGRVSRAPPLPHPLGPWPRPVRPPGSAAPPLPAPPAQPAPASPQSGDQSPAQAAESARVSRSDAPRPQCPPRPPRPPRPGRDGAARLSTTPRRLHPLSEPPSSCRGPGAHGRWRRRRRGCGGCFCCRCSAKVSPAGGRGQVGVVEWTQSKTPSCLRRAAGSAFAGRRGGAGSEVVRRAGLLRPQAGRVAGWARRPRSLFTVRAAAARRILVALGPKRTDTVALSSQIARDG